MVTIPDPKTPEIELIIRSLCDQSTVQLRAVLPIENRQLTSPKSFKQRMRIKFAKWIYSRFGKAASDRERSDQQNPFYL